MNSLATLHKDFFSFLSATFDCSQDDLASITFTLNTDEQKQAFGDISSNAALIIAKKQKTNPQTIARTITTNFTHPLVDRIEIAGPGFINCTLTTSAIQLLAQELWEQEEDFFKLDAHIPKKKISLEFVSANPTGPLHLGHGRGGIIGDVLGNICKFLGHTVTKEYYINDAGSQMQKLGASLKARCFQLLDQPATMPEDGYHGQYLIDLAQHCVTEYNDSLLKKDEEFFIEYAQDHMLEQICQTLKNYGITFDEWFSEKSLHESGAIERTIQHLKDHDAVYEKDGATWFAATRYGDDKDRVLRKANGELTYAAGDVGYLENKINRGYDHLIIVLGQDHHSYAVRLKGIMQALGYNPAMLDVILYQLVTLKESGELIRMSKRAGKMVTLEDIVQEVGKDVARFFYLNRKADAHLDFDIDLALKKTEENPVYYIQYAYVRTNSILEKSLAQTSLTDISKEDAVGLDQDEKLLLKKIVSLKNLLETISNNHQTHALAYYVIELAQLFHSYYAKNRIIVPDHSVQSRARLLLIHILRNTFKTCLTLLGLSCPEKM